MHEWYLLKWWSFALRAARFHIAVNQQLNDRLAMWLLKKRRVKLSLFVHRIAVRHRIAAEGYITQAKSIQRELKAWHA